MIVFCEDCGERNIVDIEAVAKTGKPVRCTSCSDILRITIPEPAGKSQLSLQEKKGGTVVMELRFGEQLVEIGQTRPSVTMGRQEHNDLEVIDTRVSRSHARIEYRNSVFVLIDHSTNGTFVVEKGGKGYSLKRQELPLENSGIITLGRKVSEDSPKAIRYTLKTV